ncbi:MAG: formyltransferase family protein [Candidatus Binatia bacterium]
MKTLPLSVLAYAGPQVRAYLSRIRRAGLKPQRILLIVQSHHPVTKKPIGGWLPGTIRMRYTEKYQEYIQNYWPVRIKASYPYLVDAMVKEINQICGDPTGLITEMLGDFKYESYADQIERTLVQDLRDRTLVNAFTNMGPETVLFTGGGILPSILLDIPGLKFLHVHPGYLPYVRGADGLLWSTLVRGRPGVSCFYMASGLDTGDIIAREDFPPLSFDISAHKRPDDQTLYRTIFAFYDPLLRAEMLVTKVLSQENELSTLPAISQDLSKGITYHFMHRMLRRKALEHIFISR